MIPPSVSKPVAEEAVATPILVYAIMEGLLMVDMVDMYSTTHLRIIRMVAETAALDELWTAEAAEVLRSRATPEEKMTRLHRAGVDIPFVLLPFRAVGTEGGLLLACRSDYVQIGRRTMMHTLVALTDTQVGAGGYQALWGGQEKGGRHDAVAAAHTVDTTAGQAG